MKKSYRIFLGCIVPILSILYATGEHLQWWEHISGRYLAQKGVQRLYSPENMPKILIFADDPEFRPLFKLILLNTSAQNDVQNLGAPSAVARVGGPLRPQGWGTNLPTDYPNPDFIPNSSPVVLLYGYSRKDFPRIPKDVGSRLVPVCQLQDLDNWINKSRETQRFWVSTLLIGILSVIVVVFDAAKDIAKRKNK